MPSDNSEKSCEQGVAMASTAKSNSTVPDFCPVFDVAPALV